MVKLGHGSHQRCPTSASYLLLKVRILILSELNTPLPVERPSFDGLEALLVLGTSETMTIKLGGGNEPFYWGISSRPLHGEFLRSHFLQKRLES